MTLTPLNNRQARELDTPSLGGGYRPMQPLDKYARGLADEAPRVDALATISCGVRGQDGLPRAARRDDPQHIYIHDLNDRAPGLTQALQAGKGRKLTISFPFDDPRLFVQQRFCEYSKTALKLYGDENQITEIVVRGDQVSHVSHPSGSDEYERLVERCSVSVSCYFALATWQDGPRVLMPDGLGLYRLRFTSRHSLRSLLGTLDNTARFSGGRISGIPFDASIDFREVADPKGVKRTIPVWTFVMAPPGGITSHTFQGFAREALAQGEALHMLPPAVETFETAVLDGPLPDDAQLLERGGRCVSEYWNRLWHATVRGTSLALKEARADFLMAYTGGACNSLKLFLETATESEASAMIEAARSTLVELGELTDVIIDDEPVPPAKQDAAPRATAADYVNTYEAAYAEPQAEPPAVAPEIHERLKGLKESLDEVIERHPDPAWQAAGSADEPIVEPIDPSSIDYDGCLALFESHPDLTLKKPLPRLQQSAYRSWWQDHYLPTLKAAQEQER